MSFPKGNVFYNEIRRRLNLVLQFEYYCAIYFQNTVGKYRPKKTAMECNSA
jgi:hypothetical protein